MTEAQVTTQPAPLTAPFTTHSPAPWRVHGQSETGRYITVKAANGRTVARVPWNGENTPLAECTDARDALAISLAPQALSALEDALDALKSAKNFIRVQYGSTNPAREQAIEMAEAVLTKWKAAR
jgi:hypothetical protein